MIKGKPRRPFAAKTKGRETMARLLQEITDWAECAAAAQWSVTTLARDCGVSVAQLERHFLETWGQSPRERIYAERMRRACEALEQGKRVYEVATLLHYGHPHNFTRAFTDFFGISPGEYLLRKSNGDLRTSNLKPQTSNLEWSVMPGWCEARRFDEK